MAPMMMHEEDDYPMMMTHEDEGTPMKKPLPRAHPMNIATISSGFEKGDFLVREEQGKRLYFDFFEDAFNYAAGRGFTRMGKEAEREWVELLKAINESVKGGMKYNTGNLLMVLTRPVPAQPSHAELIATKAPKK